MIGITQYNMALNMDNGKIYRIDEVSRPIRHILNL